MSSHLRWTLFIGVGAPGLLAAALIVGAQASPNLVTNGDFESGNTGFTTGYSIGDVSNPGGYAIGANPSTAPGAFGDWCNCGDHTSGTGKMMIVNGATDATLPVWEEIVAVTPSTEYTFSYWGAEVDHDSSSLPRPELKINGAVIGSSMFPEFPPDNGGQWQNYKFNWKSGTSKSADLVLVDLNTDASWNDFMLDDISFSAAAGTAGGTAAQAPNASGSGPITTTAQITVKNSQGVVITLKPGEKIAMMFLEAISSMEGDCSLHLNRNCSLAELVAGPKSPNWDIGKLKYDPARDPNYKYSITMIGTGWQASVNPQHAGLGGFFLEGTHGMMANLYFNPNGPATAKDEYLNDFSISGELFHVE